MTAAALETGGLVVVAGGLTLLGLIALSAACRFVSVNLERRRWLRGGR